MRTMKSMALKLLKYGLSIAVGFLVVVHLYIFSIQESFIFFPKPSSLEDETSLKTYGYEAFHSSADIQLGWARLKPQSRAGLFVFHGNASKAASQAKWITPPLEDLDLDIILVEYPGYADLPGDVSRKSVLKNSRASIETYRELYPTRKVILLGESLGGGPASRMAKEFSDDTSGLILIATFTSISDMAQRRFPFLIFVDWILQHNFQPLENTRGLTTPLLLIHGTADTTVPHTMSERIYAAYVGSKELQLIDNVGHGMRLPRYELHSSFWTSLKSFLESRLEN